MLKESSNAVKGELVLVQEASGYFSEEMSSFRSKMFGPFWSQWSASRL